MAVSEDLYFSWTMNILGKRGLRLPGRLYITSLHSYSLALVEGLLSVIQTIFVSYFLFFSTVTDAMTPEQSLVALRTLSFLQFARVESNLYDKATHQIAIRAVSSEEMMCRVVQLLPPEALGTGILIYLTKWR